eukprot:9425033-Pyramimonas_sp.AAC.1
MDIETAFDSMRHGRLSQALLARVVHPRMAAALLRELSNMRCNIALPGADPCERFPLEKGGKQGGVETPELFNIMLEVVFADAFEKWRRARCGFALDEEGAER